MNTPAPILALVGHRLNGFDRLTGADGQTVTYASSVLREFDALRDRVTALEAQQLDERLATAAVVDELRNRAERMERVVEAARTVARYYAFHYDYRVKARGDIQALDKYTVELIAAVRAVDAAEGV